MRPTWVSVDLDAVAHNVAAFDALVGDAAVCAVVKADGYGHGAPAVALVDEATELRVAGVSAPILVLSAPRPDEMAEVVALGGVRPTLYTPAGIEACAEAARAGAAGESGIYEEIGPLAVHLKVDTGMHRVGVRPEVAVSTAQLIIDAGLNLEGVFSHLSTADVPQDPFTGVQVDRFDTILADLAAVGIQPSVVHLANTAATLTRPDTHRSLVRVGIGVYGVAPGPDVADSCRALGLRQAMSILSQVTHLQVVPAGEGVGYGHRWVGDRDTRLATVPMGYADGLARAWGLGGEALIGGRRRPLRGVVSMDALLGRVLEPTEVEAKLLVAYGEIFAVELVEVGREALAEHADAAT